MTVSWLGRPWIGRNNQSDASGGRNLTAAVPSEGTHTLRGMNPDEFLAIATPVVQRRGHRARLSLQDREDLLQDVAMKYLQAWSDGAEPDNVRAWLETATANAIVDRLRVADRRPADNFAEGGDDAVSAAMAVMWDSRFASAPAVSQQLISDVLGLIPRGEADLLRRRYLERFTAADLADELGITVANLDQRTTRAKRNLREALKSRPALVAELRASHPHVY